MTDARLLDVRRAIKSRKPNFHIQNSNDPRKRFAGRWKRPKGLQNKMRERRKGNPRYIEPGYGSPAAVKGATGEGLFPVIVSSVNDLSKIREGLVAVVSAKVGLRKKLQIVNAAVEKKLRLLNVDADKFTKAIGEAMGSRKKRRRRILEGRKVKAQEKKPAGTPKEEAAKAGIESKVDEEARKKAEKEEKDKVLTKANY